MLRRLVLVTLVLVALVVTTTGCGFLEPQPSTTTATTTSDTSVIATTASPPTTTTDDSPCLRGDRPYAGNGLISAFGGAEGDATQISAIRWTSHPGCEQVVVDFLTADGAPAGGLNPVGVEYDALAGVIRISLPPEIDRSAVADTLIDGDLVKRAYVVATGQNLAIDVHLATGRTYALRAYEVDSPGRIIVDIKEDAAGQPVLGATMAATLVVVSPQGGPVASPLVVTGYVKGPYETVTADLIIAANHQAAGTQSAMPAAGDAIWRAYTVRFGQVPPTPLHLVVTPDEHDEDAVTISIDGSTSVEPAKPDQ
jgi:hypothetical protein